jgi:hypothetical protein
MYEDNKKVLHKNKSCQITGDSASSTTGRKTGIPDTSLIKTTLQTTTIPPVQPQTDIASQTAYFQMTV